MSQRFSGSDYKNGSKAWRVSQPRDIGIDGDSIARYYEEAIFPGLPDQIPEYAPDTAVVCKTGDIVPWTGVWVPSTGMGAAALAFARRQFNESAQVYNRAVSQFPTWVIAGLFGFRKAGTL